ncbi:TPA: type VI secretion system baseplate subunit TssE [Escherichia coli]|uniref:Type VI secretion system baseplate subunit TssE n=3 Tax=Escherichia coli TaxID=562 RepID=A0A2J1D812_ECOLX|nr:MULTISPECIES: type VI secretion system baseplate subunit TssE [Enterobacteriaceae]EEZ8703047.1 type VI secretion system baseplate subunit TssE [Escherichia coli O91]EFA4125025.1 type VI secretion system baseplate subunit TssE [Escherichia coli O49:H9]EFA4147144.1 type VI secretion system baseplate subunit TssE [Escherichia coli O99:H27]EFA8810780.1 type VI secretion system baseplate subunit TssE [Escherichia coli O8:H49]EFN7364150.1 type VI secretion system baseplate subunit TssE [Escherich
MSASRQRPGNHLLPTLFDRLCDDAPNQKRDHGISVSQVQLKEIIRRDLSFLLNTVSHEDDIDAARYPYAAASVLNYGLPPLAGSFLYEHKWDDIRRAILRTITRFEPRLKASTLQIIPLQDERRQSGHNTLQFEIRGEILTQPYPTAFRVRSALDMEQSRITFF